METAENAGKIWDLLSGKSSANSTRRHTASYNPLRSRVTERGQAALVRVNIPANFITKQSASVVEHIRAILARANEPGGLLQAGHETETRPAVIQKPEGLKTAVSGNAGYGYDYAGFIENSYYDTRLVTVVAIILILIIVYRAPLGALIPLLSIGTAVVIVVKGMELAQGCGVQIGMAEKIFVFVLMFGAGIDYSLLLVTRYKEHLIAGRAPGIAIRRAHAATFPAILASGTTDALGLFMLFFSEFLIFRTTGPAVTISLALAMLASITLVPAIIGICGKRTFWPVNIKSLKAERKIHRAWGRLGGAVVKRPLLIMIVVLAVFALPIIHSTEIEWMYDALTGMKASWTDGRGKETAPEDGVGNAVAGASIALDKGYWSTGELSPITLMIENLNGTDKPVPRQTWTRISKAFEKLAERDDVTNIRALTCPLGLFNSIDSPTVMEFAGNSYLSGPNAMRLEIVLAYKPMSNEAMASLEQLRAAAREIVSRYRSDNTTDEPEFALYLAGSTAQMKDIRRITQGDFHRVVVLVISVVFVVILLLLRDLPLVLFMIAAIFLSYLSTLGICGWIYGDSLDWKVEMFLFVVIAAVGVDYNIFLAARLSEEARQHPPAKAVQLAVMHTGPVISSCGLIMAATLGSLMAGELPLLRQLGTAFAIGMIIDTFITRPLLLPAFATLFKRTGRTGSMV